MTKRLLPLLFCMAICHIAFSQPQPRHHHRRMAFATDSVMAHDPVMAYENGTYHLLSTGMGIQWATSKDRKTWVVQSTPFIEQIPLWTHDSVPGFRNHVWAPDIIRWHERWWLAYSCSTFGKNSSAIGLMSASSLTGQWQDEGCIVASKEKRDNWNAIDACVAMPPCILPQSPLPLPVATAPTIPMLQRTLRQSLQVATPLRRHSF